VLFLLAATHAVQLHSLRAHPQPILFGDAQGYHTVGQRFSRAVELAMAGEGGAAFREVRGVLYFSGVGLAYAAIDALRPGDVGFARSVLAGFNTLSALGVFLLARRLSGRFGPGLLALALASVYPPFSVQTGRLLPDPITGAAFVWAAWCLAEGLERRRAAWIAASGLLLGAGLLVRSQILVYVILLLGALLVVAAPRWLRSAPGRRGVAAFALGLLPAALAWGGIAAATGDDLSEVEALGNFTFRAEYPYGFWQFLESDGWMGPWRLREDPYYRELTAAAEADPALLASRPRQWLFTAAYVARRPSESGLLLLDNAWRLWDRPANDYKRDYPMPYAAQVWLQRGLLLLALAGAAWLARDRPPLLGVLFVPAVLTLIHAASYPWPRFNQPAMPIVLAVAAAGAFALVEALRASSPRARRRLALVAALAALGVGSGLALRMATPEVARLFRAAGVLGLLALPFAVLSRGRRPWPLALAAGLGICFAAHEARDRRWHEVGTDLARAGRVEQEIRLGDAALARLRSASELFLVFDLHLPRGSARDLTLEVAGLRMSGEVLEPAMPRFGESVEAGGRDPRGYPQWWALRFDPARLPNSAGALRVALESGGREPAWLGGDRFAEQERVYEGPSFGDWPHRAAIKLEYDGDYRLGVRRVLGSDGTLSLVGRGSERRPLRRVHRIRLLALADRRGHLAWETAASPGPAAAAFFAFSGTRGQAQISVGEGPPFELPLAPEGSWYAARGALRLCHAPEGTRGGMHHGGYLLYPLPPGPQRLELAFEPGMSDRGMFFALDRGPADTGAVAELARVCGAADLPVFDGAARVLDASRNSYPDSLGRWSVAEVF